MHKRFQMYGCIVQDFPELWAQKGLPKRLRRNVAACGFVDPTPIQRQAIPLLLAGREVLAVAPTGAALAVLSLQAVRSGRSGDRQEEACCFQDNLVKGAKCPVPVDNWCGSPAARWPGGAIADRCGTSCSQSATLPLSRWR